jgi:hypothetical protein
MDGLPRLLVSLLAIAALSCRVSRSPITVALVFENPWTLGADTLSVAEQAVVKAAALETLRRAYAGFGVQFAEARAGDRLISVEDTPYASTPQFRAPGAAGLTYPVTTVSSVRFDVLWFAELAVTGCRDPHTCSKTRTELLEGLGRGIGATAAHELGHQAGIRFVTDSQCDDCYDGNRSTSYAHFFGTKHWSPEAAAMMTRVLPPASVDR